MKWFDVVGIIACILVIFNTSINRRRTLLEVIKDKFCPLSPPLPGRTLAQIYYDEEDK